MSDKTEKMDKSSKRKIRRRKFLATAALPLVATMAPASVMAQRRSSDSASQQVIRVGIIGAGANVRSVQIPGFRQIPQCEVLAVANRSLESSQRVADEFNIPRAYATWQQLLDDPDIDAVLIGTWPYMHRQLTLASLDRGKHVLCQARMANS